MLRYLRSVSRGNVSHGMFRGWIVQAAARDVAARGAPRDRQLPEKLQVGRAFYPFAG
jgi:hypothetical protein